MHLSRLICQEYQSKEWLLIKYLSLQLDTQLSQQSFEKLADYCFLLDKVIADIVIYWKGN